MKRFIFAIISGLMIMSLAACDGGEVPNPADPNNPNNPTQTETPTQNQNPPGTITFTSAAPQVIGLQGSGQTTNSNLIFTVTDSNGDAVRDGITVNFIINTLNGNEYIGPDDNTPSQASAQTSGGNGEIAIGLTSGTVAGVIIVNATVNSTSINAESSKISIGGGVADTAHLSLSRAQINLPGMVLDNVKTDITVLLGDRFGNYNVLQGTPVSFKAESGTINTSNFTDDIGAATVTYRTQNPRPVLANNEITAAEIAEINRINSAYGLSPPIPTDGSVNQRRGWVTVTAAVAGQETFTDNNANGFFDAGDGFSASDDIGEPYIDSNSNGNRDPTEVFTNTNRSISYDGPNSVWDGPNCPDKASGCQSPMTIWDSTQLMFTGHGAYCAFDVSAGTSIARGSSAKYFFMVGDANLNRLVPGTTIRVATSAGRLSGNTNFTVPDGLGGPTEITFVLENNLSQTAQPTTATITVTVTGPTISGTQIVGCPGNITPTLTASFL